MNTDMTGVQESSQFGSSTVAGSSLPRFMTDMSPLRTFIVEDSTIILDSLVATLEEMAPVKVVGSAPDEKMAMELLAELQGEVDLIIIDVFLKAGSGLGVLRGTAQRGMSAKRIVLTNYATQDMRQRCRALGAHRVFDKSNDLDELILYCTRLAGGFVDSSAGALS